MMSNPPVTLIRRMAVASRRTRRLLVVAAFLGYPFLQAGYLTLVAPGRLSNVVWAPLAIALFAVTLVGVVGIYAYARGRADMNADLDERQRHLRDQAWIVAYGIVTTVAALLLAALALITSFNGPITIGMGDLVPFLIGFGLYLPLLPSAALTWTEPDPPAEGDDIGSGR
jgi:hypothetical protein